MGISLKEVGMADSFQKFLINKGYKSNRDKITILGVINLVDEWQGEPKSIMEVVPQGTKPFTDDEFSVTDTHNTKTQRYDKEKSIDKVTTNLLDLACRMSDISISKDKLDKIIDLVELLEDKGDLASLKDISQLKVEWANMPKNK